MGRVNQFEPKIENLVGVVCESSGIPQVAIVIKTHDIFGSSQMFRHTHTHACTRFARMKVAHLKSCKWKRTWWLRSTCEILDQLPGSQTACEHPDVGQIEPHVFLCWIRIYHISNIYPI